MKSFHFALETVRLWRAEQAEVEELKLQRLNLELQGLQVLAQAVQEEADQAGRLVMDGVAMNADDLANLDAFREHTRTRLKRIAQQTKQCRQGVDEQRQRLIDMRRQFEMLDRLKKKAMAGWRLARDKELEELAAELFLAKRTRDRD